MNRYEAAALLSQGKTIITAHSGCENTEPNSLEFLHAAMASGVEALEVDVRMADERLYLYHDEPENPAACLSLQVMFELVEPAENLLLNLDLKTEGLAVPCLELAKTYGLTSRIVFTGTCDTPRERIRAYGAEVWRNRWIMDSLNEGIALNLQDGTPSLNVYHKLVTARTQRKLRENGLFFSAWTVDDEKRMRELFAMGIGNLTTRRPLLAKRVREEVQGVQVI